MVSFKVEQSGAYGVLTVEGDLTIHRAEELKEALIESLGKVDHLVCDFRNVTELDVPCIQLLCVAYRTSFGLRKRMTLTGMNSSAVGHTLRTCGFTLHSGCLICKENCLWVDSVERERA